MRMIFQGHVTPDGRVKLDDRASYTRCAKLLAGREVTMVLGTRRKPRSGSQNAYYWADWGPLALLSAHTGSSLDEVHEAMKFRHLQYDDPVLGRRTKSTTELSTVEWEDYMERIRADAAQMGVVVPLPNEVLE